MSSLRWRIAALKNGFQDALAYRIEFLFEVLGQAVVPVGIQCMLWFALFDLGGATEIAGLTYKDFILYTVTSMLFTQIRGGDHDFELQEMIRSGTLSNYMLKPVGVVEFVYIRGVAPKLLVAGVCFLMGIVGMLILKLNVLNLVLAMLLALIGNIIHYQIGAALATSAFLWEEAFSVLMVKNMIVSLLSGELIPLTLFPEKYAWIWKSTPFYLYVFAPTQIALGKWTAMQTVETFLIASLWLVFGYVFIKVMWALGLKRYLSLGG